MRNRNKKSKPYPKVANAISRNYNRLIALCCNGKHGYFDSRSHEDIFQDTVLYTIQDPKANDLQSDAELIGHFIYRYRMIEYQTIQDSRQLKIIHYADYLQTQTRSSEE